MVWVVLWSMDWRDCIGGVIMGFFLVRRAVFLVILVFGIGIGFL